VHILGDDFRESIAVEWFASVDYGYTHRNAVLLACRDHEDNIYVVDERAERFWITARHVQEIKAMLARHCVYSSLEHLGECLRDQFPDPCTERESLWHLRQSRLLSRLVAGADMFGAESSGASVANKYRDLGIKLRVANMDRVSGWSAIAQRLGDPDAGIKPTLFIHKRCQRLLECLPYLQHDPDRPGDVLKTNVNEDGIGGDDPADALRYLIGTPPRIVRQVKLLGL
jgi:hypothetical protein